MPADELPEGVDNKMREVNIDTINPYVMNGLSHPYHLNDSTFIFRQNRNNFSFCNENHASKDGHPGLLCSPMSHKKDARLI